jgi:hypothetical protein
MLTLAVGLANILAATFVLPAGFLVGQCACGAPPWAPAWMILIYGLFAVGAGTLIAELVRLRRLRTAIAIRRARHAEDRGS